MDEQEWLKIKVVHLLNEQGLGRDSENNIYDFGGSFGGTTVRDDKSTEFASRDLVHVRSSIYSLFVFFFA